MKKNLHNKVGGFTLIELLVVIAIIGILSSIVLVSLSSARSKGKDTRVVSDVNQIRTWLESNNNGSVYNDISSTAVAGTANNAGTSTIPVSRGLGQLLSDANSQGGAYPSIYVVSTGVSGASSTIGTYSIYGKTSNGYFCVSSGGNTVSSTTGNAIPAPIVANTGTCQ